MTNPWFRLYTEAVDDEKLRLLDFADRWHFVAILCCKGKGILDEPNAPLARRKVAVKLGLDMQALDEVAQRLADVELIDAETLQPLAWDQRQFASDHDPTNAERQKRFRDNKKAISNAPVTDEKRISNAHQKQITEAEAEAEAETEAEAEAEAETEAEAEAEAEAVSPTVGGSRASTPTRTRKTTALVFPNCPEWLSPDDWDAYQQHRREKRAPLGPTAAKQVLSDLEQARSYGHDPSALIREAISAGWTGCVFRDRHFQPPKPAAPGGGRPPGRVYNPATKHAALAEHNSAVLSQWLDADSAQPAPIVLAHKELAHATH